MKNKSMRRETTMGIIKEVGRCALTLPFDSHNHVHMGPTSPLRSLLGSSATFIDNSPAVVSGMAIMSTHPRDFERVLNLSRELPAHRPGVRVVPCFGVHPWFLHELTENDWETTTTTTTTTTTATATTATTREMSDSQLPCDSALPRWISEIEERLTSTPESVVGEIGLDGFHFDPVTRELTSPMDKQLEAFKLQMELAARLQKPVSIHTVQCFGHLMEALSQWKKSNTKLPPKMYFHAFGGKCGTVDQLLALCGREPGQVYFGFAPVVNFRSPKTAAVIRKVGLERLVLETDHEDAACIPKSMEECIRYLSEALEVDEAVIVQQTTANAFDLYGLN